MVNFVNRHHIKRWTEKGTVTFVWLLFVIVFLFSLVNLFIFFLVPVDGATIWIRQGPVRVLNTASTEPGGLREGDVILTIQNQNIDWWLAQRWRTLPPIISRIDDPNPAIPIMVLREGKELALTVPLALRPGGPTGRLSFTHMVVGIAFLIAGWIILRMRSHDLVSRLAALIMLLMALIEQNEIPAVIGAELGWSYLWLFIPLRLLTRWFTYSYALVFSLSFPQPRAWLQRRPYLTLPIHLLNPVVTLVIMMSVTGNLHHRHAVAYSWSKYIYIIYLVSACAIFVHTYFTTRDIVSKNQLRWIAWGAAIATIPNILLADLSYLVFGTYLIPTEVASLLLLFIPISVAIAILRYRLWNIDLIIKASLVYGILTAALGVVYLTLVSLFIAVLGQSGVSRIDTSNAGIYFISALVVAVLFTPLRAYVQRLIDRLFYRDRLNYADISSEMTQALATSLVFDDLLRLLRHTIPNRLNLTGGMIVLDIVLPRNSREIRRLKRGRLLWLHDEDLKRPKKYPAPLDQLKQAGMWACAPLLSGDELLGLYGLGPKKSDEYYNSEEIKLLETLARQAGVALENARLHEKLSMQVRVERDLEIARQIQLSLLPAEDPQIDGLDIVGFSMPSQEVGGDFYHYLKFDESQIGIAVGDVSGKGVSAALFMAVSVSTLQAKSPHHRHTPELLAEMNNLLHVQMRGRVNTALLYTIIRQNSNGGLTFSASNAGLISPLLRRCNEANCHYVDVGGLPLGVMKDVNYQASHVNLQSGDLILLCSDGVVEAKNVHSQMFGFSRLEKFMAACDNLPAAGVIEQLRRAITTFVGSAKQHDDITMVAVRVK